MKRIIIVICLLAGMVSISIHAAYTINSAKDRIKEYTKEILIAAEDSDKQEVLNRVDILTDYWTSTEYMLINYVRRDMIENMSQSISHLYPLAEYEDWPAFHAELLSISWQIESIHRSEEISFQNIF